jgi:hypothetical protein
MYIYLRSACDKPELVEIVWISVSRLQELWNDPDVAHWNGNPRDNWFLPTSNRECLLIPELQIERNEQNDITFVNGRHRTRWLIQEGYEEIPVGILKSEIELGTSIGLIRRVFEQGECLRLPESN